jgi:hypothetical protein
VLSLTAYPALKTKRKDAGTHGVWHEADNDFQGNFRDVARLKSRSPKLQNSKFYTVALVESSILMQTNSVFSTIIQNRIGSQMKMLKSSINFPHVIVRRL